MAAEENILDTGGDQETVEDKQTAELSGEEEDFIRLHAADEKLRLSS